MTGLLLNKPILVVQLRGRKGSGSLETKSAQERPYVPWVDYEKERKMIQMIDAQILQISRCQIFHAFFC